MYIGRYIYRYIRFWKVGNEYFKILSREVFDRKFILVITLQRYVLAKSEIPKINDYELGN